MKTKFLILLLAVACARSRDRADTSQAARGSDSVLPKTNVSATPSGIDSAAAVRLVEEYAQRDASGERLASSDWFKDAITEPDHEPGYDSFTAISRYQVQPGRRTGDTLEVPVVYDVIGELEQVVVQDKTTGLRLVSRGTTERTVFPVIRSPDGKLRIVSPQIDQHVLAAAILTNQRLPALREPDREKLKASAKSR